MTWCSCIFCFKQKTAYERRISDWSSDVCSSDLPAVILDLADIDPVFANRIGQRLQCIRPAGVEDGRPVEMPVRGDQEIGRASCRVRVCQYVLISVVAVSFKKHICITDSA